MSIKKNDGALEAFVKTEIEKLKPELKRRFLNRDERAAMTFDLMAILYRYHNPGNNLIPAVVILNNISSSKYWIKQSDEDSGTNEKRLLNLLGLLKELKYVRIIENQMGLKQIQFNDNYPRCKLY